MPNTLVVSTPMKNKKWSHLQNGFKATRNMSRVRLEKIGAGKVWVRRHKSGQNLRPAAVRGADQTKTISQDPARGGTQEHEILQVAQRDLS